MGWRVGGWEEAADARPVVERNECYVLDAQLGVRHSARLDRDDLGVVVDLAHVAEARVAEPARGELEVRRQHPLAERSVHELRIHVVGDEVDRVAGTRFENDL